MQVMTHIHDKPLSLFFFGGFNAFCHYICSKILWRQNVFFVFSLLNGLPPDNKSSQVDGGLSQI